jgi:hypothetical protein
VGESVGDEASGDACNGNVSVGGFVCAVDIRRGEEWEVGVGDGSGNGGGGGGEGEGNGDIDASEWPMRFASASSRVAVGDGSTQEGDDVGEANGSLLFGIGGDLEWDVVV